ncbi:hypothetical protein ACF0H5_023927 [Mactra antiquata]
MYTSVDSQVFEASLGKTKPYKGSSLDGYQSFTDINETSNLTIVGVSSSDSALHRDYDMQSKAVPKSGIHRNDPKGHQPRGVRSHELRRKSEASCDLHRDSERAGYTNEEFRRKSEAIIRDRNSALSKYKNSAAKDTVVLTHQRRSVVHVSGGSRNTRAGSPSSRRDIRRVVTSQPLPSTIGGPSGNPDWPALTESEFENNGNNGETVKYSDGKYGINSVGETVKGLVKLFHAPFQCCKREQRLGFILTRNRPSQGARNFVRLLNVKVEVVTENGEKRPGVRSPDNG